MSMFNIGHNQTPPSEAKTMKKAALVSVLVTTIFYIFCSCFGYATFGDSSPGKLLTGFGFYNPYWLLDIANVAIVIHLVGAFQVFEQRIFAFIERLASNNFPNSTFFTRQIEISKPGFGLFKLNLFRLVWWTVIIVTLIAMLLPFFNDITGLIGAFAFWPLALYFPMALYIKHRKIPNWSTKYVGLQLLCFACFLVSLAAAVGSAADVEKYKPFKTEYQFRRIKKPYSERDFRSKKMKL